MNVKYLFLFTLIFLLISTLFTGCATKVEDIESEEKAQESSEEVVSGLGDIAEDLSDIEDIAE